MYLDEIIITDGGKATEKGGTMYFPDERGIIQQQYTRDNEPCNLELTLGDYQKLNTEVKSGDWSAILDSEFYEFEWEKFSFHLAKNTDR